MEATHMRTALIVTLFLAACTAEDTVERTELKYSTNPTNGMCVVNPSTAMSAGWMDCQPECTSTNMCAPVCPALVCSTMDPTNGGMTSTPTNTMTGTVACPAGYTVDADGCPTCDCAPECDPTTMNSTGQCPPPPPPCDPMTNTMCPTPTGGGGSTMCDPTNGTMCPSPTGGGNGSGSGSTGGCTSMTGCP
jgi:hypothetical protein